MKTVFAALTTLVFLALIVLEVLVDLIWHERWAGHGFAANYLVYLYVPLWLVGAVAVWLRTDLAWVGIIVATLACFVHGVGATIGGDLLGPVFLVAAPVLLFLAWNARRPDPIDALAGRGREEAERERERERAGAR